MVNPLVMSIKAFIAEINRIVPGLCNPNNTDVNGQYVTIRYSKNGTNVCILALPTSSIHVTTFNSAMSYCDVQTAVNELKNRDLC